MGVNHKSELNLFCVHSPLQVVSAHCVSAQYFKEKRRVLFCEDRAYQRCTSDAYWDDIFFGLMTRSVTHNAAKNIRANLAVIDEILQKYQPRSISLYVSELQWMCNNAIYTYLARYFTPGNLKLSFIDEGFHLYIDTPDYSIELRRKRFLKYFWMRFHRLPCQLRSTISTYKKENVHAVYCYHPELLESEKYKNCHICSLSNKVIGDYSTEIGVTEKFGDNDSALFLSQPYYRHIPPRIFKNVLRQMKRNLSDDVKHIFYKPHPSDSEEWMAFLEQELGFKPLPLSKDVPIELVARYLDFKCVVGISSSALLNLRKFGYTGDIISFGADACSVTREFIKIHEKNIPLLKKLGVVVVSI
ncbi:MAG: hypothetical protein DHS20C10_10530 [marine bacterium B5-7]|nr:MAG: hypothetical protein DHS20C10_10530 [marine bacterium B5-7]